MSIYWAHSAPEGGGERQPLADHLRTVSALARQFAEVLSYGDEASLAGLLHDCGKYGDLFQMRLEGKARKVDHWSTGAYIAGQAGAAAAAAAIKGHHVGLPSLSHQFFASLKDSVEERVALPDGRKLAGPLIDTMDRFQSDGLHWEPLVESRRVINSSLHPMQQMLGIRFLYSCLVDADFLDTEAHFLQDRQGNKQFRNPAPSLDPDYLLTLLEKYVAKLAQEDQSSAQMKELRRTVYEKAVDAAGSESRLRTLTAPTGSGKTLAMLAFALHHAKKYGKRRIVVALPYLNIIEETVKAYREALPGLPCQYILEHHSLAERDTVDDDGNARLAMENWDAPIVVTTSVQLLESLFSNRPGRARKLHQLADSVMILDEIQTLPLHLVVPTVAMLAAIGDRYHATVVLGTATQPAFDLLSGSIKPLTGIGYQSHEIVPTILAPPLRVNYSFRDAPQSWEELADELSLQPTWLAIVNLKRHARDLSEAVQHRDQGPLFHLSTNLCSKHRSKVLETVKVRFACHQPVRLVATQCVEAGVNLDFPVLYRAWGPLDSIIQAAGRCNRGGGMPKPGDVVVFQPEDDAYPPGPYRQFTIEARNLWKSRPSFDVDDPETIRCYWQRVYDTVGLEDAYGDLIRAVRTLDFPVVNDLYRLIDQKTAQVLVPYRAEMGLYDGLVTEARQSGLSRDWIRRAQPLSVGVYLPKDDAGVRSHLENVPVGHGAEAKDSDWWICRDSENYDPIFGLTLPSTLGLLQG